MVQNEVGKAAHPYIAHDRWCEHAPPVFVDNHGGECGWHHCTVDVLMRARVEQWD